MVSRLRRMRLHPPTSRTGASAASPLTPRSLEYSFPELRQWARAPLIVIKL